MIRPNSSSSPTEINLLKTPELPRFPVAPNAGFTLEPPGSASAAVDRASVGNIGAAQADVAASDVRSRGTAQGPVEPLREAFHDFVGQTMFGQMLASMRSTVGKPAYFHGGRAEEVFSEQLDQLLVEKITDASASTVADPMFELFNLQRSQ